MFSNTQRMHLIENKEEMKKRVTSILKTNAQDFFFQSRAYTSRLGVK